MRANNMAKHPHAELMMQYAEDAAKTDEPWLLWEYRCEDKWKQCIAHPSWAKTGTFRRKPEPIKVGIYEFPKPEVNSLKIGDKYWYVEISDYGLYAQYETWTCSNKDYQLLNSRLIHTNREDAQQHADVLNKIHRIK